MTNRLRAQIFWVRLPRADVGAGLWQEQVHRAGAEAREAETGEDASWFSRGDLGHGGKVKFALLICLSPLVFVEPLFDILHEMIMLQIFTKVVSMTCMFGTHKELSYSTWGSKHLVSTCLKLNWSC